MLIRDSLFCLVLLVLPAFHGGAQAPSPFPGQAMRTVSAGEGVKVSYFDRPTVVAAHTTFFIQGSRRSSYTKTFVALTAIISQAGSRLTDVKTVRLHIFAHTVGHKCWLDAEHRVAIRVGGELREALEPRYAGHEGGKGDCSEELQLDLPFRSLTDLAANDAVSITLGAKTFSLKEAHLRSLKALVATLGSY